MTTTYVPQEGDRVVFPKAPYGPNRTTIWLITTVWASGSYTMHSTQGKYDIVAHMDLPEMLQLGVEKAPALENDAVLEMERVNRENSGSPEAQRWERAQFAFEFFARRTQIGTPHDWDSLAGTERAIWHDMVALLEV